MPVDFAEYLWELFTDDDTITILFTWFVLGSTCFALFVMPHWQDEEAMQARKEEGARAVTATPVVELRKAA